MWALAAVTHEEAQYHFSSRARWQLYRDKGLHLSFETPDVSMAEEYNEYEQTRIEELRQKTFVGTGKEVAERITELANYLDVEEIAIVTWAHSDEARRNSYSEISKAFNMKA